MLTKLLSRRARAQQPPAQVPAGERIYAIGDIHGRLDRLDELLALIAADGAARADANTTLVFLGDLIDRGPDSAGVVERLRLLAEARPPRSTRFLLGNHEEVFLMAVAGDLKALKFFNRIGGRETILSYGITEREYLQCDYPELLALFQARVPAEHVAFLNRFEDMIIAGDYVFVHAGVRPDIELGAQKASDLRWIRDEFLACPRPLEKLVVHGHSIAEDVEILPHRIGLDTGAFASGKLSAMGFEGGERWVLQTEVDRQS